MGFDKKEMIEQLNFEIEMMEKGRYYPSAGERREPEIFRESITCPNAGLERKTTPCSSCFLIEFVPPAMRGSEGDVCHQIPLNEKGDTIESLKAADDPYKLQATVLGWLKTTVGKLEREVAAGV
jgi:hypothetical protein